MTLDTTEPIAIGELRSIGLRVPNSGPFATADAITRLAQHGVAAGFDTLWAHDHIPWPATLLTHFACGSVEACTEQDPNFFESVSTAAFLAGLCPGTDVGLAGLVLPLRDPRVLAKQLMTVQELSGGRLISALAIGNIPNDFNVMEVPYERRGRITDEFLAALAAIYEPGPTSFTGDNLSFAGAEFYPKPTSRFWIAGNSEPAFRRLATYASGWLPGCLAPDTFQSDLRTLEDALAAHGRDIDTVERGLETFVCVAPTTAEARAISEASLQHRFGDVQQGVERNVVGDPSTVAAKLDDYRTRGVSHFELRFICHSVHDHLAMIDLFAERVLPQLVTTRPLADVIDARSGR